MWFLSFLAILVVVHYGLEVSTSATGHTEATIGSKTENCSVEDGSNNHINSNNIDNFAGCLTIHGDVIIVDDSFSGMHPDKLEIFNTAESITGIFHVVAMHEDFKNLSYFRNVKLIQGSTPNTNSFSLSIEGTSLESLGLISLKSIRGKGVLIRDNDKLCLVDTIKWKSIAQQSVSTTRNGGSINCELLGMVCDSQCSDDGCWGPGPNNCRTCRFYHNKDNECVNECHHTDCKKSCPLSSFEKHGECLDCNEQCVGCFGPSAGECTHCKHLQEGAACVHTCPARKYDQSGKCIPCPEECEFGCSEINDSVQCTVCVVTNDDDDDIRCIGKCPIGYFRRSSNVTNVLCSLCDDECDECYGPGPDNCNDCKNDKIYQHQSLEAKPYFSCVLKFESSPDCIQEFNRSTTYHCHSQTYEPSRLWIYAIISIYCIILMLPVIICYCWVKKTRNTPADDSSNDRLLPADSSVHFMGGKFSMLHCNERADSQSGRLITIKKYNESSRITGVDVNRETIMLGNLKHKNLLEVSFIPMGDDRIKLINQEMPFGNVLEFMKLNYTSIEPVELLKWCTQTAEGMLYLEQQSIVHGNLNPSNLLLDGDRNIKIKNVGFIYLLDSYGDRIYSRNKETWQEMDIHINRQSFNHKTDVFAFGITAWRVLTYGRKEWNFNKIDTDELIDVELVRNSYDITLPPCPQICKPVLNDLLKPCWYKEASTRPSFVGLASDLKIMMKTPDRYIGPRPLSTNNTKSTKKLV